MEVNADLAAVQALTGFTEHSQQEQDAANRAHSARNLANCETGLAGSTQTAAYAVGQSRDEHWNSNLMPRLATLVDNNRMATSAYHDGQDTASAAMGQQGYGMAAVINGQGAGGTP